MKNNLLEKFGITPGPWHACCLNKNPHYVFSEGEKTICKPMSNDPTAKDYQRNAGDLPIVEKIANSRLIAKAPEMLLTLIKVVLEREAYYKAMFPNTVTQTIAHEKNKTIVKLIESATNKPWNEIKELYNER